MFNTGSKVRTNINKFEIHEYDQNTGNTISIKFKRLPSLHHAIAYAHEIRKFQSTGISIRKNRVRLAIFEEGKWNFY